MVDLGIYRGCDDHAEGITVQITPTFVGCPALEMMSEMIVERLAELLPGVPVAVAVTPGPPWTSDQISEEGASGSSSRASRRRPRAT